MFIVENVINCLLTAMSVNVVLNENLFIIQRLIYHDFLDNG